MTRARIVEDAAAQVSNREQVFAEAEAEEQVRRELYGRAQERAARSRRAPAQRRPAVTVAMRRGHSRGR